MFDKLKFTTRLHLGFGLVLALLLVLACSSWWQMNRLADNTGYYIVNLVPSYETEHQVSLALGEERRKEFRHVLSKSVAEMDQLEAQMADIRKSAAGNIEKYAKDLISDEEDARRLENVRTTLAAYYAQWDLIRPMSRQSVTDPSKVDDATRLMTGASSQAYEAAEAAVQHWWDYNVKLSADQEIASRLMLSRAITTLLVLAATALAIGVGAAAGIARSTRRQLGGEPSYAVEVANRIARGDLSMAIHVATGDNVSIIAALLHMNDNLARIVGQVRASSDSIATGSSQIATGNADLSQRTEEQASNLQQTAASMEQLSGTVKLSAETAGQANRLAASASAAAVHGGTLVSQAVITMGDIAVASKKIGDIIGVIDGIAFQTNILALNAAVEAARAGEQGRGFAVVASEVRNLAGRSAEAAKEIKSLIGASVRQVEVGTRQVNESGDAMGKIVAQVQRVSQMIGELSNASAEQATGISQVGDAVTQLDQVTQQNAALVEESAAAAESLKVQAAALAGVVSVFRLKGSDALVAVPAMH